MKTSEIKTADSTSGGYFEVSVVKISARSDELKGRFCVTQVGALHEKLVLRKTQNKFEQCIFSLRKVEGWFHTDSIGSFLWRMKF
jgi:hypothetical protein